MYSGYGFHSFEIGDVDVVYHDGIYHLFHLTLPNHDYIAHAVSQDGIKWERVKNALFVSDPKAWDDDMLWTMHITPNPYRPNAWRMFYTGLCMGERGRIQRIGLAHSQDLYHWEKDTSGHYPLEISGPDYETQLDDGRQWVSFRDPFCFMENGRVYLLATARTNKGPVIRRGCTALAQEVSENQFDFLPPIFSTMHYDELEVPNLFTMDGRYYLVASIREDVKVHYWWANQLTGPYYNFADNVLMPQGNYAARIIQTEETTLLWNFFFRGLSTKGEHLMVPPKELTVDERGELHLKSFAGFRQLVNSSYSVPDLAPLQPLFGNPTAFSQVKSKSFAMGNESGYEAFLLDGEYQDFILTGELSLDGNGKCGLVIRLNEVGDGYYLSLDLFKGVAQIRAWGHRARNNGVQTEEEFEYEQLQAAHFVPAPEPHIFKLIAYEQYLEFSLHNHLLLTLADERFQNGRLGFYVESATIQIKNLELQLCTPPQTVSYPDDLPNY